VQNLVSQLDVALSTKGPKREAAVSAVKNALLSKIAAKQGNKKRLEEIIHLLEAGKIKEARTLLASNFWTLAIVIIVLVILAAGYFGLKFFKVF